MHYRSEPSGLAGLADALQPNCNPFADDDAVRRRLDHLALLFIGQGRPASASVPEL